MTPDQGPSLDDRLARFSARGSGGQLSPLASVGGWRGVAETLIPGLVFTLVFTLGGSLMPAVLSALAVGAVFTAARLLQRQPLAQALSGLVGVGICAVFAARSGRAQDFFLPGLIINAVYLVLMLVSVAVRWPAAGLLFGFLRGEGTGWRSEPARLRQYSAATIPLAVLFAVRLAVKAPLYFSGSVAELGVLNAVLGVPAFALALWIGWLMSRPRA
ncbi:DUF3159 domain-containing protein [Arthrobacter sp. UM1]|uniref:DUF3159 domain-containing protein n=1 Tax=Arthrobacter sp. UM1 TaxID=2766776 RepID=UPI001CF65334|nr:DUF3159 domain-containing protein [Arthrobacter sp. UM1]MCB4207654.1 DUF3159 domain-containing protein [Arthrobacter sp. UM1]